MKQDLLLLAWELAIVLSVFGLGRFLLRLLQLQPQPLFVTGVTGISAWIALGGILNALHLVLRPVLFALVGAACVLGALPARHPPQAREISPPEPLSTLLFRVVLTMAVAILGCFVLSGMRGNLWNYDDLQGYIVMAVKALQLGSIQPDFFCERRVQAGIGGANFLDSWMLAGGDFRAMQFVDSGLGLALYALGIWAIGKRLKVPRIGITFALLCLPFLTLIKVNLTIVYLSVAGLLAILYLLLQEPQTSAPARSRALAIGLITGGLLTTKSTNLPFLALFFLAWAALLKLLRPGTQIMRNLAISTLTALLVAAPWSWQNKRTAGTYLYPLLGKGFHGSAYGLIPTPSQIGNPAQMIFIMLPALSLLGGSLLCSVRLTRSWPPAQRSALLAFIAASLLSVPIITFGLGGEAADRYTAPFVMPSLLLAFLVIWRASDAGPWASAMKSILALAAVYCTLFLGFHLGWYRDDRALLFDAFGLSAHHDNGYYFLLTPADFQRELAYGASLQRTLPPGATAIEDMQQSYPFDFRRNTIYVQDTAGLASPAPGFPILGTSSDVRRLLLANNIQYIIFDRSLHCDGYPDWPQFLRTPRPHATVRDLLRYPALAHRIFGWSHLEEEVACQARDLVEQVAQEGETVYDDGHVLVARIR